MAINTVMAMDTVMGTDMAQRMVMDIMKRIPEMKKKDRKKETTSCSDVPNTGLATAIKMNHSS